MGQKTNSNILRLGLLKNNWPSQYNPASNEDFTLTVFNTIEIKKYLKQFFKLHGINLHKCYLNYSNNKLTIVITYFVTFNTLSTIKRKKIRNQKISNNHNNSDLKYLNAKKQLNFTLNNFLEPMVEGLMRFTKKRSSINMILKDINKHNNIKLKLTEKESIENTIIHLRKFSNSSFFNETINTLVTTITKTNSSELLANLIALQLSKMKKHNYFLVFLKRSLNLLFKLKFLKINGIKLVINGRFNGAPRSKSRLIQVGTTPLQSFKANINYSHSTAYTANGTFGVKVWICN